MPWRGSEIPGEFPSLGYEVADFIQAKCAIPDGDLRGQPYILTDEMLRFLLWFYRLDPETGAFVYDRGGQLVRAQKWGKSPFGAAIICAEAAPDGPVRFAGWDARGEPVGKPVATPVIQVVSVSEDSADNVWSALVPMIEHGELAADIPDTGLTRIFLPSGGRVEPVTSAADSRLGARLSFCLMDETHLWVQARGGHKLAGALRRNIAGMGGRWMETTNAWDPREDSVAQRTSESTQRHGVHFDDVEAGPGSIRNKAERRRMLKKVYGDSWWVDLDRIESEIIAMLGTDPTQAERFFLNRKLAGEDAAFDHEQWKKLTKPRELEPGKLIVIGVDGARFDDALAIVATHVGSGYQWPLSIIERPPNADDAYEHDFDEADGAVSEAFERWNVWRMYVDPQWIDHLLDAWQGRYGEKRVIAWQTHRPRQIAWAVRNYTTAIGVGDVPHDADQVMSAHVKNARKQMLNVKDDTGRAMHTLAKDRPGSPRKIDAAMAGVLSWEARGDAIAAGVTETMEPLVAWR